MIELADIALARYRLSPYLRPTPLEQIHDLGPQVWFKLENVNKTRSFKVRGALNAMLTLNRKAREKGIIACSSGNHAQGVAYAAHLLGTTARVLMPTSTPRRKVEGVHQYGSQAILFGDNYDEAEDEAHRLIRDEGATFISPYNDPLIVAGAGTIGLEIIDSLPDVERVLVPVSGGGLISGVALALKSLKPSIEVIGVCAESAPAMYNLFYDTALPQVWETLAEALSGEIEANAITISLTQRYVDEIVLVSEEAIAEAMRWLLLKCAWVVEGGGAVGVAALRSGVVEEDGRSTVVVLSGGNVDEETLSHLL
ncbi:MAG: threonine/serine dehydratase [Anaerolineae bacterium]|nr:threonine/serine dehydratase [Anaerolineae bacterium]